MAEDGEPVVDVLGRLETELAAVAGQLRNVELALAQLVRRAPAIEAELFADLQQLDHALQVLMALKSFTGSLAAAAGRDWLINARASAERLELAALAGRLGGTGGASRTAPNGEIELF